MAKGTTEKADENARLTKNLKKIKNKILVMSGKGGVGKSTVAVNLAFSLSDQGMKVGILDVDIHGPNVPKLLNIEDAQLIGDETGRLTPILVPPGLKVMSMAFLLKSKDSPVIWRGPVKMGVIKQFLSDVNWGDLDYLVIDLPPGTGDEPLSIVQLIPDATGAVIVTTPQELALLDSRKSVSFAKQLNLPVIGIVENMSGMKCPHCNKEIDLFKTGGGEIAAKEMDVPFLGRIPIEQKIVEMGDNGEPFVLREFESAIEFRKIVDKIKDFRRE
ncbi:MAG: Mrp/NBP35 family ATP-binding protein [Thermoplasmata archaeon]|nr:Mrp/NBP35 family ATP-binding protein [Thermoplasmata archaeon]